MPVRKIPKNYLSATGNFSSRKNGRSIGYESLLERDLMILLEFDETVESFEEQPVHIPFSIGGKQKKPYVPDILIQYRPSSAGEVHRPVLGEVKHTDFLKKYKAEYAPKFEAAERYAGERNWEWRVFTQKDIRTPYLDNLKFLREYHSIEADLSLQQEVMNCLRRPRPPVTIESLLQQLCPSDSQRLQMVPVIWYLIATKRITTNLKKPLDMEAKLSLP